MRSPRRVRFVLVSTCMALGCLSTSLMAGFVRSDAAVHCAVETEEVVTRYVPANNGAGPLWCYGSPLIVRRDEEVFVSIIETGKDVPPLLNTRWQLWRRSSDGWKLEQHEQEYRQREPCPIALSVKGPIFLSVNPSAEPAGATHGRCE